MSPDEGCGVSMAGVTVEEVDIYDVSRQSLLELTFGFLSDEPE
jgi:hypothetical protein